MYEGLQRGIYHAPESEPGNSFAIVFLRVSKGAEAIKIRNTLTGLWRMYSDLQKGVINGLNVNEEHLYNGNLSVLVGYGPKIFEFDGVCKSRPIGLDDKWLFREPSIGGGSIIGDSGLKYSDEVTENEIAKDHVVVQLIGDTQLATHRAVVETWKTLNRLQADPTNAPLVMRTFYTGFNRPDRRSWLGFHDGVSNVESSERSYLITINKDKLPPEDYWTANGTYLAFIRITIDLASWEEIPIKQQERLVGRIKSTGCPIVGIDQHDNNIPVDGCPAEGTYEILDEKNKSFRAFPMENLKNNINSKSDSIVENSHIARVLKDYNNTSSRTEPDLIFRQSYEFLEQIEKYPYFRVGLNFISFQGDTERLYKILEYGFGRANFGGDPANPIPGSTRMLLVQGSGLFFVPPILEGQEFPGEEVFDGNKDELDQGDRPIRYL